MSKVKSQDMSNTEFKELSKMDQQLVVVDLIDKIYSQFGLNEKGVPLLDYAKNGICKGV